VIIFCIAAMTAKRTYRDDLLLVRFRATADMRCISAASASAQLIQKPFRCD
jgi:hypothetical protein